MTTLKNMLLSLNWLKKYVNLPKGLSAKKLAHDLTMATVEVESVEDMAEKYKNIVVGRIVAIKNHPNADKLKIVMVDVENNKSKIQNPKTCPELDSGSKINSKSKIQSNKKNNLLQIVCGGTNLKEGMLVPVALPGAKVKWHGEGELVDLEEAELRGVKSCGMICSSNEIGLENLLPCDGNEVTDLNMLVQSSTLNQQMHPGQNLAKALGLDDIIIELDNKSITHRPDLWNHYGIARELSVIYKMRLGVVIPTPPKAGEESRRLKTKGFLATPGMTIKIENKKLCPRYIGCLVKNVKIEPSPRWLQKSLEAVGLRPINNIVDITNYVMLDVGEPMHAFDKSKVKSMSRVKDQKSKLNESEIIIRTAKNGEKIKTLDGVERKLDNTILVIADEKKPIALAGIMGGLDSGVDEDTKEIILEAANFGAVNIRKTTQKLNIRTEASNRFEKKLDPEFAMLGMQKAIALIKEILPEAKIGEIVDANCAKKENIKIKVSHEFLESRIGLKIKSKEVVDILKRLGFEIKEIKKLRNKEIKGFDYIVYVPSWRATGDIDCPEDIVEEVARVYGYDKLIDLPISVSLSKSVYQPYYELINKAKEFLALNAGLNEVFNYPWVSEICLKKLGKSDKMIELANPPSEDNKWLQTSLIPNLIKNTEDNLRYLDEFGIFELARVYNFNKTEPKMLSGAIVSDKNSDAFLEVKGVIENLFYELRITNYELRITKPSENYLSNEKHLAIFLNDKKIGWLGELKKEIYQKFNFKNRNICLFEINFDELVGTGRDLPAKKYKPLPQFPTVARDLAFELEYAVKWSIFVKEILKQVQDDNIIGDDIAVNIEFLSEFDLGNKKSLAFRITYQANRTLTDKEVDLMQEKIIKLVEEKFNGRLRVALKK